MKKNNNNPWDILKIRPNASMQDIKSAYKTLAKRYHPDRGGTIKQWLSISTAYEAIMNKKHVPVVNAPDTKMVNLSLSIHQQVHGLNEIISVDIDGEEVYINVSVPPGALKDDKFYIRDGKNKYIINIKELSHPEYTRRGLHLATYKKLDFINLLKRRPFIILGPTGNYIEVEIPLDIMKDTNIITVLNEGLYDRKTKKRGNLVIHVDVNIPILTEENLESFITRLRND